jgi:hypothetical protein
LLGLGQRGIILLQNFLHALLRGLGIAERGADALLALLHDLTNWLEKNEIEREKQHEEIGDLPKECDVNIYHKCERLFCAVNGDADLFEV